MAGIDIQGTGRKKLRWQLFVIILSMAALKFLVNLMVWGNYELHREAYLAIEYADHPAWGYIENPPFIMWMSWISMKIFGGSTFALRFFPALAGAMTMFIIGNLTKDLGGKKWAVLLATTGYLVAPVFLKSNSLFLPSAFTEFFWFSYLSLFVKLLQTHNKNYWFMLGFVAGLGFLSSYTIFIPMVLTTLFLFATRHRHLLYCPQITGFLFNFLIFAIPNLIWQFNHKWPEFKNLRELNATQLINFESAWFLAMQLVILAPVLVLWTVGLYNLFATKASRPFIVLGYSYVGMILLMLAIHAKPFYPAPFYMILIVFGAIQWENWLEEKYTHYLVGILIIMATSTILLLPLSLPYLKLEKLVAFSEKWQNRGLKAPFIWEDGNMRSIPQDYADMTGWNEFYSLSSQAIQKTDLLTTTVFSNDKNLAAAFNYYSKRNGGKHRAYSLDGSFAIWSPEEFPTTEQVLFLGDIPQFAMKTEIEFEKVAVFENPLSRLHKTPIFRATIAGSDFHMHYEQERNRVKDGVFRKPR